jgi:hypothetical protein
VAKREPKSKIKIELQSIARPRARQGKPLSTQWHVLGGTNLCEVGDVDSRNVCTKISKRQAKDGSYR